MKSTIIEFENPDLRIYFNLNEILLTLLLMLIAVMAIVDASLSEGINTTLSGLEMGVGVCLLLFAIIRFAMRHKAWYYIPTQSKMNVKTFYFDDSEKSVLIDLLKGNFPERSCSLKSKTIGKVRLEMFYSEDKKIVMAQVFQYDDWCYKALTEVAMLSSEQLNQVLNLIKE